jgi:predicted glycoside hydrolase/deacetylase ChbG (UPF0249 family)
MQTISRSGITNAMLGYPADARLLLVNADDFGMFHAVNAAIVETLQTGIVTSCSVMAPCPWANHALAWLRAHPDVRAGVHLTSISEQPLVRWGPVTPRSEVPSLVDETGSFYAEARMAESLARTDLAELAREYRAQIEFVLAAGVHPTHLDSHCGTHVRRADIFDMTLGLAHEYGLALRVYIPPFIDQVQQLGLPTNDHPLLDSYRLPLVEKAAAYAELLRSLPAGFNEWAVHPGFGNEELRAAMPSWEVRQSDYDFVMSPEAQAIIAGEGIILVDYAAMQQLWQGWKP